jgi:glycosyltransferase involved in cell wall biosynthesis
MHVLITADTIGGVWSYTQELVTGLVHRGVEVTLVSFGDIPALCQTSWIDQLQGSAYGSGFTYHPTAFKLEWMQNSQEDMRASAEYLRELARETKPDLLHFNQFYYGALDCDLPRIVVAHSDVVSWWVAVHGTEPPATSWLAWYREVVTHGLARATAVVAPSRWMMEQIERYYATPWRPLVIYNGRTPATFNPYVTKEDKIATVGRIWDLGKNAGLLLRTNMPAPVYIVGTGQNPEGGGGRFYAGGARDNIYLEPQQNERKIVQILGRASIYAAPSQYEPFGLAPVEAALSRCALVVSDIPSFRELWQRTAVFFRKNDAEALRLALELLVSDSTLRKKYANLAYDHARRKFTADRMVESYLGLYRALAPAAVVAA